MKLKTREKQYSFLGNKKYRPKFGLMSGATWVDDPKRLLFLLSRYKFVSKLLDPEEKVLEVGCADAFGSRIVAQSCAILFCTDFDPIFIRNAKKINRDLKKIKFRVHDYIKNPIRLPFRPSTCFCLDVLEHIPQPLEDKFIKNLKASCDKTAMFIFGSPSLESQEYASKASREGHVNCKTGVQIKETLKKYFSRVLLFSMNDEVLHTGYEPMAHYRLVICSGKAGR